MMRPEITIEVTAEDIQFGERGNVLRCPITRAAVRAIGAQLEDANVYTGRKRLDFWADDNWAIYLLPNEATEFVDDFDSGDAVSPFTFTAQLVNSEGELP